MNLELPVFSKHPSCADSLEPDMWFPEEVSGISGRGWSYTPSAKLARSICQGCEAFDECKDYALEFQDLAGIWADQDRKERYAEQVARGIKPRPVWNSIVTQSRRLRDEQ
jgi:hypothetical protein